MHNYPVGQWTPILYARSALVPLIVTFVLLRIVVDCPL